MNNVDYRPRRCGVVLAGGDGKRLQPFVRKLLGFELPKQYVSFTGNRSMLEHTFDRAEQLISPECLFTVVARDHLGHPEVRSQLSGRIPHTVVVQPMNRETGPGLLLPLTHLLLRYPNSTVAVFPSDHFVLQEDLFAAYVQQAFEEVERYPSRIVFLGVEPTDAEPEYGYILPEDQYLDSSRRKCGSTIEKWTAQAVSKELSEDQLWVSWTDLVTSADEPAKDLFIVVQPGTLRRMKSRYYRGDAVNMSETLPIDSLSGCGIQWASCLIEHF